MLRRHAVFVSALLFCLLGTQDAKAESSDWHWIRVEPNFAAPLSWDVFQGATVVEFAGKTFKTRLSYETGQVSYQLALEGSISDGKIAAIETQIGTDAPPRRYSGFLERTPETGKQEALERIVLEDRGSFTYIALMRRPLSTNSDGQQ